MTDEALGRLTGMWLGHRWGRIQDNNAAKSLAKMYGYDWDADKQSSNQGLWDQAINPQNNIAQYTRPNAQTAFDAPQSQGLFAQALNAKNNIAQYTRPQQESNTEFYNTLQQPFTSGPLQANEGLWQTVLKQKEQQPFAQATQSFNQTTQPLQANNLRSFTQPQGMWPNPSVTPLSASVNGGGPAKASNYQPLNETNSLGIPDRNAITQNYQRQMGKDIVALVKGGMSLKDAQTYAANRMQGNIDKAYSDYVNKFTDDVLEPMRQDIINNLMYTTDKDGNTVVDAYNSSKVKGMYGAVMRYNTLAQKVGAQGIDINNLASAAAINKPNFKDTIVPNGHLVRVNGDTGEVVDVGNYGKVSPYGTKNGHVLMHDDSGNVKDIGAYGAVKMQQLQDGTTFMVSDDGRMTYVGKFARPVATGGRGGSTATLQAQQLRSLASLHSNWVKQHPDADEDESPYYGDLQSALASGSNSQTGSDDHAGLTGQDKAVADLIDKKRMAGVSPEQIKSELEDAFGKGNYYEDWIW